MNTDDWKDFINNLFVSTDGRRKSAVIGITLEVEEGKLALPPVEVAHTDTLQQVFIKVAQLLASPTKKATATEEDPAKQLKTVNVEHIQHGNTEYIVYRLSDDSFNVIKSTGEVVTPKGIVYNTVVKKYRKKFNLD
jgi:NhaP-type Na+/H+ and K+/H+ antiporter